MINQDDLKNIITDDDDEYVSPEVRERRAQGRVPLQLKVAVVYHQHLDDATRPTFHGVTNNVSPTGLSVVVDHNIFSEDEVTVLLAVPPQFAGARIKVIEATARMVYTVYSNEHYAFRIGMRFCQFKDDGLDILRGAIKKLAYI